MLNQQIRKTIQQIKSSLPTDLNILLEQGAGEISALDIIEQARKVGEYLPEFDLTNQYGKSRTLAELLQSGPLILTFYRGLWCPYCNLQLKAYADRLTDIEATGATLVAISPERPDAFSVLKKSDVSSELIAGIIKDVPFEILRDKHNVLAKKMGLAFNLPDAHQRVLRTLGIDVKTLTDDSTLTFPDPATYVVKPSGEIAWSFVPNNYRKRAEVDEILDALTNL
ncbi:MAG: AhpC/TSA family protein [Neptuniibacter sp.]